MVDSIERPAPFCVNEIVRRIGPQEMGELFVVTRVNHGDVTCERLTDRRRYRFPFAMIETVPDAPIRLVPIEGMPDFQVNDLVCCKSRPDILAMRVIQITHAGIICRHGDGINAFDDWFAHGTLTLISRPQSEGNQRYGDCVPEPPKTFSGILRGAISEYVFTEEDLKQLAAPCPNHWTGGLTGICPDCGKK
jgi:hypothetical protein